MSTAQPFVGGTISHYRVAEKLGGGIGVVYKAEDARLDRFVALEFLPDNTSTDAQTIERFQGEARASSALSHPISALFTVLANTKIALSLSWSCSKARRCALLLTASL